MGDLVNLRQVRKRKQRDDKARKADQNRALHGRTRGERTLDDHERKNADKQLDGHKLTDVADGDAQTSSKSSKSTKGDKTPSKSARDNVVPIFGADEPSDS